MSTEGIAANQTPSLESELKYQDIINAIVQQNVAEVAAALAAYGDEGGNEREIVSVLHCMTSILNPFIWLEILKNKQFYRAIDYPNLMAILATCEVQGPAELVNSQEKNAKEALLLALVYNFEWCRMVSFSSLIVHCDKYPKVASYITSNLSFLRMLQPISINRLVNTTPLYLNRIMQLVASVLDQMPPMDGQAKNWAKECLKYLVLCNPNVTYALSSSPNLAELKAWVLTLVASDADFKSCVLACRFAAENLGLVPPKRLIERSPPIAPTPSRPVAQPGSDLSKLMSMLSVTEDDDEEDEEVRRICDETEKHRLYLIQQSIENARNDSVHDDDSEEAEDDSDEHKDNQPRISALQRSRSFYF